MNTAVRISPYEIGDYPELERHLSIYDKATFSVINAFNYDTDTKTLIMPRGFSISSLEKHYGKYSNTIRIYDNCDRSVMKLNNPPRDEKQVEAINFLLGKENYEDIKRYSRLLLELDTGVGKTYCTIATICYMKTKSAIILNSTELINQWTEKILEYTNLSENEIFVVSGVKSIEKILAGKTNKHKIYLVSHKTIGSYARANGWDSISEVFKKMGIGIKVFDEAHKELMNTIHIDMYTNTRRTVYLTATAERSSFNENKLYSNIYGPVPALSFKRSKEEAYVTSVILKYDSKPNLFDKSKMVSRMGLNGNIYAKYEALGGGREYFYRCLYTILNTIKNKEPGKIAILALRKDVVWDIKHFIENNYPEYKDDIGIMTSDITKKEDKLEQKKKTLILTTSKSFGTGIDLPGLRYLIMAEPYSSKVTLRQVVGRLRNIGGELYYFELVDVGISHRVNQFNNIKKDLLKLSKKCTEFSVQ